MTLLVVQQLKGQFEVKDIGTNELACVHGKEFNEKIY